MHTGPGAGSDLFARGVASVLEKNKLVPQRIQINNRTGGGGPGRAAPKPSGPRLPQRVLDGPTRWRTPAPERGHAVQPAVPERLVAGPGPHGAEAAAPAPRARPGPQRPRAGQRLAAHPKKAHRRRAPLALLDARGLLVAPLVRRTVAVRGQRPVLQQRARQRDKVSVAGALGLSPRRDRLGLVAMTLVNAYFASAAAAVCLQVVRRSWSGAVVAVGDPGQMHHGEPIRAVLAPHRHWSREALPPYAPALNPGAWVWKWRTYEQRCTVAPRDAQQLEAAISTRRQSIQGDQEQLRQFIPDSDLPLRTT